MQPDEGGGNCSYELLGSHIREHGPFYHRLAYGVLRNAEAAADACQQAFLQAWQHRDQLRGQLKPWLVRVVLNQGFQGLRQDRAEKRVLGNRPPCPPESEDPAVATERRDLVLAAMNQLPESVRAVVSLRIMQGLSGNEVGELLGISVWQVSRQLHEGLDRLRTLLGDQGAGEIDEK